MVLNHWSVCWKEREQKNLGDVTVRGISLVQFGYAGHGEPPVLDDILVSFLHTHTLDSGMAVIADSLGSKHVP